MLLVIFVNIRYICLSVYIFREFCLSDCLNYETVHIKTGIDMLIIIIVYFLYKA